MVVGKKEFNSRTVNIVIDARFYQQSGIGRYLRNLILNLKKLDKNNNYFILHLKEDYNLLKYTGNFHKVLADFRWYGLKEQLRLPKLITSLRPDLVHFPHFNTPMYYKGKFIVTIHDLIHQHYAMTRATTLNPIAYRLKKVGYEKVFKSAIINSSKILTPTEFVAGQLMYERQVDREKIMVTPEAVDTKIITAVGKMSTVESQKIINTLGIQPPYVFYIGNAHPHKNIEGLIEAFRIVRKKYGNLQLVLSGEENYFWKRVKERCKAEGIMYTGYIDDKIMVALYRGASCFVMPSFEEGFGIPILEAMACGCPVVSSNAGALMEIGGDACLYFNPYDKKDMVEKISIILADKKKIQELIERGEKRYKQFSWERLAKQILSVYQEVLRS